METTMTRKFMQHSRMAYAKTAPCTDRAFDDLLITLEDGDLHAEFSISFHHLSHDTDGTRLNAFDDSWRLLAQCPDLLAWMGSVDSEKGVSPKDVVAALKGLGFLDISDYPEKGRA